MHVKISKKITLSHRQKKTETNKELQSPEEF